MTVYSMELEESEINPHLPFYVVCQSTIARSRPDHYGMKPMKKTQHVMFIAALFPILGKAAVVSTLVVNPGTANGAMGGAGDAGQDAGIITSLITTGQSSLSGIPILSRPPNIFTAAGLNNGTANVGDLDGTLTFFGDLHLSTATVTFKLTDAYNISSIVSLAGWQDTFFGSQIFTLYLEQNNSGLYNQVGGTFSATPYTPTAPVGFPEVPNPDFSTRVTVSDDASPYLATNVTAVRFIYQDPYPTLNDGGAPFNGTVIRELSVFGTVVPEPSMALSGVLGLAMLTCRRHRSGT